MEKTFFLLAILMSFAWITVAHATFNSGSTGALGAFSPTANIEVVLPPDGILNYTTVNIPSGVTVTFKKNIANAPVYMLATGDVTIAGTINVSGTNSTATETGKGGPGGYDGGYGGAIMTSGGKGLGPGGGYPGRYNGGGGGGGFAANGNNADGGSNRGNGGQGYGNPKLLPLIGGSGGGGGSGETNRAGSPGGGGGGAIVIASSASITVTGTMTANGGSSQWPSPGGGGGSGGAIKLVANTISGNGTITATYGYRGDWGGNGSVGRIRLEADINNRTAATNPAYSYGLPTSVFLSNSPSLSITSVAGTNAPANPAGQYNQPDILLPSTTTNPVAVNISAANIPTSTLVNVWVIPQYGDPMSVDATLSGTQQSSTASANVNLSAYPNVITAEATFTVVAMYYDGEQIDKVHVAATMGGKSETTYITKSGKRIKGELVAALTR